MNYNNGKVYHPNDKSIDEQYKMARDFSEGNPILEQLLLSLWKRGIRTIACCNGHDKDRFAYLSLEVDNNYPFVNKVMNFIEQNRDAYPVHLNFTLYDFSNETQQNPQHLIMIIDMPEASKNHIFKKLDEMANTNTISSKTNDIVIRSFYLSSYAREQGLNFCYSVDMKTQKMMLGFVEPNCAIFYREKLPDLRECIEQIKSTNQLLLTSFKCNSESVDEFLSIVYGSIYKSDENNKKK